MKSKPMRKKLWRYVGCVVLLALSVPACSSNDTGMNQKRMFVASKEFKQGRDDGRRDAKNSWSDTSAAWTWTWMMGEQYKRGYQQGWREGRAEAKFQAEKQGAEKLQQESTSDK